MQIRQKKIYPEETSLAARKRVNRHKKRSFINVVTTPVQTEEVLYATGFDEDFLHPSENVIVLISQGRL